MRAVNLLPRDDDRRKQTNVPVLVGVAGGILVTGVVAVLFTSAAGTVRSLESDRDAANAELAATPPPVAPSATDTSLRQQQQQRVSAVADALGRRTQWDRVLREVSLVLPEDVWLSHLSTTAPIASTSTSGPTASSGAPSGFLINGYTYSQESVARLLARLQVIPDLTQVTLQQSTGSGGLYSFTIVANVKPRVAS